MKEKDKPWKKYLVKSTVAVMARDEREARNLFEEQLVFSRYGEHPLDSANVISHDAETKIDAIVEMTCDGTTWVVAEK